MPLGVNIVVVILVLIGMPEAKSSHFKVVADTIWHKGVSLVESVMRNVALWDWLKATPMCSNLRSVVFAADTIWHKEMSFVESVMRNVALWDWLKATPMCSNLRSVVFARLVRAGLGERRQSNSILLC
jgi:hypothetical protein